MNSTHTMYIHMSCSIAESTLLLRLLHIHIVLAKSTLYSFSEDVSLRAETNIKVDYSDWGLPIKPNLKSVIVNLQFW